MSKKKIEAHKKAMRDFVRANYREYYNLYITTYGIECEKQFKIWFRAMMIRYA